MTVDELPAPLQSLTAGLRAAGFDQVVGPTSESFGDTYLDFNGRHFRVRCVRERGNWYVVIAETASEQWFDPDVWRSCIHQSPLANDPRSLEDQAEFILASVAALDMAAHDPEIADCLATSQARRARQRSGIERVPNR